MPLTGERLANRTMHPHTRGPCITAARLAAGALLLALTPPLFTALLASVGAGHLAIRVTSFRAEFAHIGPGVRTVRLHLDYQGPRATHYRASERRDFTNGSWNLYGPTYADVLPHYTLRAGPAGPRTIYVQLRSGESADAPLSNIVHATVQYRPMPAREVHDPHRHRHLHAFREQRAASPRAYRGAGMQAHTGEEA